MWDKLVQFIQKELSVREKLVLVGMSKVSFGLVPVSKHPLKMNPVATLPVRSSSVATYVERMIMF